MPQGQAHAEVLIDALQPAAVRELGAALVNTKSATLRFAAASKIVDLGQQIAERKRRAGGAADAALLERVEGALRLRQRKAQAVDAVPAARAGDVPVTAAAVDHSPQAPDT